MSDLQTQITTVSAFVVLGGFAIQQTLQVFDIPLSWLVAKLTSGGQKLPLGMTLGDFKKNLLTAIAFVVALVVVRWYEIGTLKFIGLQQTWLDNIATALVLSAGTEGTNTLLKYFGYVKDTRKLLANAEGVAVAHAA